jgi:hypothetical protein
MDAYIKYGRSDLADCVAKGWKYVYLTEVIGRRIDAHNLNALWAALRGRDEAGHIECMAHWAGWAMDQFQGHPDLDRIISSFGLREFQSGGKWFTI